MQDRLQGIKERHEELTHKISTPEVIADNELFSKLCKEHSELTPIVERFNEYESVVKAIADCEALLANPAEKEYHELAELELAEHREKLPQLNEQLKLMLLPKDPNDDKSVIIEIRGGAGGDEAALFASNLLRMYSMYAESKRWKVEMLSLKQTELGGIKEVAFEIDGNGAYSRFKYESGVHRVQRVPETESSGRIHTSTVTVAVLPEVPEVELVINPNDLKIDVYRSSGAGGQHVNTTDSAIRITHIPTGLVVSCQDEKSQHKNKDKAMKILRSRLFEILQDEQNAAVAADRRKQVGTGNRNERIRTYNYPQGRVTDHRVGLTINRIDAVLNGDIDEIVDALHAKTQLEQLSSGE